MGQKVNPISLRLQKTNRHFDSCWYDDYNYTHLFLQDLKIQNYLKTVLHQIKYPESRIYSHNTPKKSSINLFYYNPSNSRRKKSGIFQLQNFKDNKKLTPSGVMVGGDQNSRKTFSGRKNNKRNIDSFFSFPEQQYWKNNTYTLAQQQIEGFTVKADSNDSKSIYKKGSKKNEKLFSFSHAKQNLYLLDKKVDLSMSPKPSKNAVLTTNEYIKKNSILAKFSESVKPAKTKQYISLNNKDYQKKEFSLYFTDLYAFFCSAIFSNKQDTKKSIDRESLYLYLLQFVVKNNYIKDCGLTSPVVPGAYKDAHAINKTKNSRFFVRYLLAQLYCTILQNKEWYALEGSSTLYKFLVLFKEQNIENNIFLNKYRHFKENNENCILPPKTDANINSTFFPSRKNNNLLQSLGTSGTSSPFKQKMQKKHSFAVQKGVYSSNLVYKSHLEYTLSKQYSSFFNINLFRTLIEKQSALFLVQEIIHYLERKVPFRRIKTQILRDIPHYKNIKGVRIKCSGRVGGRSKKAQRSKTQSVKIGQTSLGVFSSKIDFACKSAYTRFGLIGVKVWVCYQ